MTIGRCVAAPNRAITPCERPPGGVRFTPPEPSRSGLEGDRSMSRSAGRRGSVLILVPVLASLILALLAPAAVAAASHSAVERAKVIVTFHGPPGKAAERVIEKYGGKVRRAARARQRHLARPRPARPAQAARRGARRPTGRARFTVSDRPVVAAATLPRRPRVRQRLGREARSARRPSTPPGIRGARRQGRGHRHRHRLHPRRPARHAVRRRPRVPAATTRAATTSSTTTPTRWTTTATGRTSRASSPPRRTATSSSASRRTSTCTRSRSSTRTARRRVEPDPRPPVGGRPRHRRRQHEPRDARRSRRPCRPPSRMPAAAGLLMVAASGNVNARLQELFSGCPVAYPAAYPQVLSTTFTNQNDALTGYSCTGPEVDFAVAGRPDLLDRPDRAVHALRPTRLRRAERHLDGLAAPRRHGRPAPRRPGSPTRARPGCSTTSGPSCARRPTPASASTRRRSRRATRATRSTSAAASIDASDAVLPLLGPANTRRSRPTTRRRPPRTPPVIVPVLAQRHRPATATRCTSRASRPRPTARPSSTSTGTVRDYTPAANYNGSDPSPTRSRTATADTDTGAVAVTVTPHERSARRGR